MKIINLTPHAITLFLPTGDTMVIEPSGVVARVNETIVPLDAATPLPVPVCQKTHWDVQGVPPRQKGVVYFVSAIVAQSFARSDVVYPGEVVRDEKGNIIGVKSLAVARRITRDEADQNRGCYDPDNHGECLSHACEEKQCVFSDSCAESEEYFSKIVFDDDVASRAPLEDLFPK